ncbi:MAG: phosphatase PAP2 family protein [Labilithrix sp.]|nr:phosphatase PAP2 family protein [Labilithrix sp.]
MNSPIDPERDPVSALAEQPVSGILPRADESGESAPSLAGEGFLRRLYKNLACQDLYITVYLTLMMYAVLHAKGEGRESAIRTVVFDAVFFSLGIFLTRGAILRPGSLVSSLVYRLTVFFPVFFSYFQLRSILPTVSPHSLDADLLAFDLRVFGVEPCLAWDRYVTPHTTEWFAFFYFLYFFLLCAHVLPMLFNASSRSRLAHFALGAMMVAGTGQLLYMVVPGYGPYHHLAGHFENPLEGGLFWRLVQATVAAGGSQKDIFPSLHTAVPTYFAIFSYMHRRVFPFKLTWPFMAFTATQIIIATMFLRWHYLIDIIAGLALATTAAFLSRKIVTWETERRRKIGAQPIFSLLEWPRSKAESGAGD